MIVDLGTTGSQAGAAINSAFNNSSLVGLGWTLSHVDGAANITSFLSTLSTSTTAILYIPTYNNSSGDLTAAELAAINANPGAIDAFVSAGGGLFAMSESGTGAWGWLTTLVPGLTPVDVGTGGVGTDMTLTPEGASAFPGLTNADLAGADPWHNYFTGNLGGLQVLATALDGSNTRNVILGGGVEGRISSPEPSTIVMAGMGLMGVLVWRRHARKSETA